MSGQVSENVVIEQEGGVLSLTLARPEKKNALTDAMYGALTDALHDCQSDDSVRVALIRARGDLFCAGNDIGDFMASDGKAQDRNVFRFIRLLGTFSKPLVAAVQGRAVGIGTTMLLHCDYVLLAEDAVLATPFVNLGLVPEAGSSLLLPSFIGHQRAFAMLAMGEPMDAGDARAAGLANRVVPSGELDEAARKACAQIAALPPSAVQTTKRLMRNEQAVAERIAIEGEEFAQALRSAEAKEAFTAFAEKRAPDFSKL